MFVLNILRLFAEVMYCWLVSLRDSLCGQSKKDLLGLLFAHFLELTTSVYT